MSLTDTTYYVRDINLPVGTNNDIVATADRYEPDILRQILGYSLAKLVLAYNVSTSPQRIKDLVEGKEYTEGTETVKWNGLLNDDKVSILAYYVFIQYVKDHAVDFQNVGAGASNMENSVNVGPSILILRASASLRELVGYPGQDQHFPSLYNYMSNREADDYPNDNWQFDEVEPVNQFGI